MDITVRRASASDIEALLPLVRAYRVFYRQAPDEAGERRFLRKHLRDKTSTLFFASDGARVVGFVQIFESWSTVRLAPVLILEDLFVDPPERMRGIGRALIHAAVAYARETGGSDVPRDRRRQRASATRVRA